MDRIPDTRAKYRRRIAFVTFSLLVACCPPCRALNPSLDVNQYAHNAWPFREGFSKGLIRCMAQTPDGYLWLGTEFGLLRFDGVRASPWAPPGSERIPEGRINKLAAARDGTLWIGGDNWLLSWNGVKLIRYPEFDSRSVLSILEDHEGVIWVGVLSQPSGRLCSIRSGRTQCYGEQGELGRVLSLYEDGTNNLWVGSDSGLWRWKPGPPVRYAGLPEPEGPLSVDATADQRLLIATGRGLAQIVDGQIRPYRLSGTGESLSAFRLLRDRDGGMWIGTQGQGLWHIHQGRTDVYSRSEGLSSDTISALFEDREGNIWAATRRGLDRFRDFAVSTASQKQGFSNDVASSVLSARDGAVWTSGLNGLDRWKNGAVTKFSHSPGVPSTMNSLFQDDAGRIWVFSDKGTAYFQDGKFTPAKGPSGGFVNAVAEDKSGDLWLSEDRGLFRWDRRGEPELFPWSTVGQARPSFALLADPHRGGVWFGGLRGGVYYFKDGRIKESFTAAQGLGQGRVSGLQLDPDGTLWAATAGGLSAIRQGRIATLSSKNGLPCDAVFWKQDDNDGAAWLYMSCGLVRIPAGELGAWAAGRKQSIQTEVFEESDGVASRANPGSYSPAVAKDSDGRIWFVSGDGISMFDPRRLAYNKLPPPVHIESVTVDDKPHPLARGMRLPANPHEVQIDYTALSFAAPEKVRFKYMLEGQDSGWHEPVSQRRVQYTNLRPRNYRFRVIACNNSGVWNETGDIAGVLHRPGLESDRVVLRVVRGRLSGHALGAVPAAAVSDPAGVQRAVGRARGRADARRAGVARYAAAELSGFADPDAGRAQHS